MVNSYINLEKISQGLDRLKCTICVGSVNGHYPGFRCDVSQSFGFLFNTYAYKRMVLFLQLL
jgi:hypothetical protein